jgi:hypothetical protein
VEWMGQNLIDERKRNSGVVDVVEVGAGLSTPVSWLASS